MAAGKGRQRRASKEDERAAEAQVLAWWRAVHGDLPVGEELVDRTGRVVDPLLLPVRHVGGVAALRLLLRHVCTQTCATPCAVNANELAAARSWTFSRATDMIPAEERMRTAVRLANVIDAALAGNDDRAWAALDAAVVAIEAGEDRRREFAALEHLTVLADFRQRILSLKPLPNERPERRDPLGAFRELADSSPPKQAFDALVRALPGLANAVDEDVLRALEGVSPERRRGRGNKSAAVALARLMVRFRFPGRRRRVGETETEAVRRVTSALADEWRGGRRGRVRSGSVRSRCA